MIKEEVEVRQHNKGYWFIDFYYKGDRKRIRVPGSSPFERQINAQRLYAEATGSLEFSLFSSLAERWFEKLKLDVSSGVLKQATFDLRKRSYRDHLETFFENKKIVDLKMSLFNDFLDHLKHKGLEPRSINLHISTLNLILEFGYSREVIPALLKAPRTRIKQKERDYLSAEEMNQIINALPAETKHGYRWRDLVKVQFLCALRIGEVIALKWEDIQGNNLLIQRSYNNKVLSTPKNNKIQSIPLSREAKELLESQPKRGSFIFGGNKDKPANQSSAFTILSRTAQRTIGRRVGTHILRRSPVKLLLDKKVPIYEVSKLLRHSDIRTTEQAYASISKETIRGTAEVLSGLLD